MMVQMEVSWLRVLQDIISSYLILSSSIDDLYSNPAYKYYIRVEKIAKLLKPVLDDLVGCDAALSELLGNGFEELAQYVYEIREQFESWQPLSSRILYVLRIESLASKLQESSLEVFQLLKRCEQHLPPEFISPSFEDCIELVKLVGREEISSTIDLALVAQSEGIGPTSEVLVKSAEHIGLRSNKDYWKWTSRTASDSNPLETSIKEALASPWDRPSISSIETDVKKLIEDLNSLSLDAQRNATARIRILSRNSTDNRIVIARCGAINSLVNLLYSTDERVQADAVTCLLNLSINDNNKSVIADSGAIEPLIHVLKTGSLEAIENSAATLFSLSVIEENKTKIGNAGAIEPLVDLLGNGSLRGKKDAATALFNLTIHHENKAKVIEAGAVRYLVELMHPAAGMVEKAVVVLANLATIKEGKVAIGEGGIRGLVEVVELGSARGKENATAALLQLCMHSPKFCNIVIKEGAIPSLVALTKSGTARAKEKAHTLLKYFKAQKQNHQRIT